MRVRVEFEAEATRNEVNDCYSVEILTANNSRVVALISSECVTPLRVEEPTEPGFYRLRRMDDSYTVAYRSPRGSWFLIGATRSNTWQELGNFSDCKKVDLNALLD